MSIWEVLQDITNAAQDVIDAYFIQTDLKDINLTSAETNQAAYFDAMASNTSGGDDASGDVPIGKQVW